MTTVTEDAVPARTPEAQDESIQKAVDVMSQLATENIHLYEELLKRTRREEQLYRRVVELETSVVTLTAQLERWQKSKLMRVQRSYWQLRERAGKRARPKTKRTDTKASD